jgi:hypothetical protein
MAATCRDTCRSEIETGRANPVISRFRGAPSIDVVGGCDGQSADQLEFSCISGEKRAAPSISGYAQGEPAIASGLFAPKYLNLTILFFTLFFSLPESLVSGQGIAPAELSVEAYALILVTRTSMNCRLMPAHCPSLS